MAGRFVIFSPSGNSNAAWAGAAVNDIPAAITAALKKVARLAHPIRPSNASHNIPPVNWITALTVLLPVSSCRLEHPTALALTNFSSFVCLGKAVCPRFPESWTLDTDVVSINASFFDQQFLTFLYDPLALINCYACGRSVESRSPPS